MTVFFRGFGVDPVYYGPGSPTYNYSTVDPHLEDTIGKFYTDPVLDPKLSPGPGTVGPQDGSGPQESSSSGLIVGVLAVGVLWWMFR